MGVRQTSIFHAASSQLNRFSSALTQDPQALVRFFCTLFYHKKSLTFL
jgi:hypothetical protein